MNRELARESTRGSTTTSAPDTFRHSATPWQSASLWPPSPPERYGDMSKMGRTKSLASLPEEGPAPSRFSARPSIGSTRSLSTRYLHVKQVQ